MGSKKDDPGAIPKSSFNEKLVFCIVSTKRGTVQEAGFYKYFYLIKYIRNSTSNYYCKHHTCHPSIHRHGNI